MFLRQNMIYLKETRNLTPYNLSKQGIPLTTAQQIINGTTIDPRLSFMIKLSQITKISIDDLINKNLSKEESK